MNDETKGADRESIARTASEYREAAAKNGVQISQSDAVKRVERAVVSGDLKRANNHR